jgi:hypothetical protein
LMRHSQSQPQRETDGSSGKTKLGICLCESGIKMDDRWSTGREELPQNTEEMKEWAEWFPLIATSPSAGESGYFLKDGISTLGCVRLVVEENETDFASFVTVSITVAVISSPQKWFAFHERIGGNITSLNSTGCFTSMSTCMRICEKRIFIHMNEKTNIHDRRKTKMRRGYLLGKRVWSE